MSSLRSAVQELTGRLSEDLLDAIRGASLDELLGPSEAPGRAQVGRPKSAVAKTPLAPVRARNGGHADIQKTLDRILYTLKKNPKGLRSEDLRAKLGLEKPELQRAVASGLAASLITKTGEKRATTFFAK